jgi:hypothetical protein
LVRYLLGQLPVKRRFGPVIEFWLEFHSAIPYHIGLPSVPRNDPGADAFAGFEARQAALEARSNTVEVRMGEIEKRLFLNPPAA